MAEGEESSQKEKPPEKLDSTLNPDPLKCSVPPAHVKDYQECCEAYEKGEMTDLDVLGNVINSLKKIKEGKE